MATMLRPESFYESISDNFKYKARNLDKTPLKLLFKECADETGVELVWRDNDSMILFLTWIDDRIVKIEQEGIIGLNQPKD